VGPIILLSRLRSTDISHCHGPDVTVGPEFRPLIQLLGPFLYLSLSMHFSFFSYIGWLARLQPEVQTERPKMNPCRPRFLFSKTFGMSLRSTYRPNSGTPSKESNHADSGCWTSAINGSARRGDLRRRRTACPGRMPRAASRSKPPCRNTTASAGKASKNPPIVDQKGMAHFDWNACLLLNRILRTNSAKRDQPLLHRLQSEPLHSEWWPASKYPTAHADLSVFPDPGFSHPG